MFSRITIERDKLRDYILTAAGAIFLALGKLSGEFPLFVFLGIAPLLSLYYNQQKESSSKIAAAIKIYGACCFGFLFWNITYSPDSVFQWFFPFIYSLAALLSFVSYRFTERYVSNRLGLVTWVIYWLAFEFLMFWVHPEFSRYLLASAFNGHPHLISWNVYTGYMGVSLWILLVNILFYYAILKDDAVFHGNIRWIKVVYALVVICLPFFFNTEAEAITRQDLLNGLPALEKQVSGNGEFIGKTALWVSILLLLYSFVKREMTKND